jgi:hypothetical protein
MISLLMSSLPSVGKPDRFLINDSYIRRQQNQSRDNRNLLHFHTPKINLLNANGVIFPRLSCPGPVKA